MANQTLNWTIDRENATITFGKLMPMMGNTYDLSVTGGESGKTYTFYVMTEDGLTCLAKSEIATGATTPTITFNTEAMCNRFTREWHEVRSFHTTVSDGSNTIAEGDLEVEWNPVWTDIATGTAATMKGDKGDPGDDSHVTSITKTSEDEDGNYIYTMAFSDGRSYTFTSPKGNKGADAIISYVKESNANKYHSLSLISRDDEYILVVNNTGVVPEMSQEDATIEANIAADNAKKYAYGNDYESGEESTTGAKQYYEQTQSASATAIAAVNSAKNTAIAAVSGDAATSAKNVAVAAVTSQQATSVTVVADKATEVIGDDTSPADGTINKARDEAITAVNGTGASDDSARQQAIAAVNSAKDTAITAVNGTTEGGNSARQQAITAVQEAATNAIGDSTSPADGTINKAKIDAINEIETSAVTHDASNKIEGNYTFSGNNVFTNGIKGLYAIETCIEHTSVTIPYASETPTDVSITNITASKNYMVFVAWKNGASGARTINFYNSTNTSTTTLIGTSTSTATTATYFTIFKLLSNSEGKIPIYVKTTSTSTAGTAPNSEIRYIVVRVS